MVNCNACQSCAHVVEAGVPATGTDFFSFRICALLLSSPPCALAIDLATGSVMQFVYVGSEAASSSAAASDCVVLLKVLVSRKLRGDDLEPYQKNIPSLSTPITINFRGRSSCWCEELVKLLSKCCESDGAALNRDCQQAQN